VLHDQVLKTAAITKVHHKLQMELDYGLCMADYFFSNELADG